MLGFSYAFRVFRLTFRLHQLSLRLGILVFSISASVFAQADLGGETFEQVASSSSDPNGLAAAAAAEGHGAGRDSSVRWVICVVMH